MAVLLCLAISTATFLGLVDDRGDLDAVVLLCAATWLVGSVAGSRGIAAVEGLAKSFSALLFSGVATCAASAALAAASRPLADQGFVAADRALFGFDIWPNVTSLYADHGAVLEALAYAYVSIEWQPFLLAALLCFSGKVDAVWTFVNAWTLSLLICLVVFPWCPAVGAYAHFNIPPARVPEILVRSAWHYPVTLMRFKLGEIRCLDFNAVEGIIAMPSFHACASVLLGWTFRKVRFLVLPFVAVDAAMWVSSVPIGGHYGVDVVAGSLVAVASILVNGAASRVGQRPRGRGAARVRDGVLRAG